MIIEKLSRVIYEFDNHGLYELGGKSFDEIIEAFKKGDETTRDKILDHVDRITKEKLLAMKEGGML